MKISSRPAQITAKAFSILALAALFAASSAWAQTPASSPSTSSTSTTVASGQPSEEEMMKMMMDLAKLNENHKLLAQFVGTWTADVKMWMNPDPNAKPTENKATTVRKALMGGRYFMAENDGKMPMPGPDGKMKETDFKGMSLEAYDNVKKKFIATWIDSMGTGILVLEGDYDPAAKAFTYTADCEMMPGMKTHVREVLKVVDNDHHILEWYDNTRGTEAKTMEISYTRKK